MERQTSSTPAYEHNSPEFNHYNGIQNRDNEPYEIPFFEGFDQEESMDNWTVIDANADNVTWHWSNSGGYNYTPGIGFNANGANLSGDDWLFTPILNLNADRTYKLSFFLRAGYGTPQMKIRIGNTNEPESQNTLLMDYQHGSTVDTYETEFNVVTDGTYHISFYVHTPVPEDFRHFFYIDDVAIEEVIMHGAPERVNNLKQIPGTNGDISMGLSWTNPNTTFDGSPLTELTVIYIYKNNSETPIVYTDNLTPGANVSWNDSNPYPGKHTYRLVAVNSIGESYSETIQTYVGIDFPGAPKNLSANLDEESEEIQVNLLWEDPEFGKQGGWYDPTALAYRIIRNPGNTVLESNYIGNQYTDNSIIEYANYSYSITSKNNTGFGATTTSEHILLGGTVTLPIVEDWEDKSTWDIWTILDVSDDDYNRTWQFELNRGNERPTAIAYVSRFGTYPNCDEWLFSPPVQLHRDSTYRITFSWQTNLFTDENMIVTFGKDKTPAAQINEIVDLTGTSTNGNYTKVVKTFTPSSNITKAYIGFHIFDTGTYIYLDDIKIEQVLDRDMEAIAVKNIDTSPTVGTQVTSTISYKNNGTLPASNFTVQLIDDEDNVLNSAQVTRPLGAGLTGQVSLQWTPEHEGSMTVRGKIIYEQDQGINNNITPPSPLNILPQHLHAITIGTDEEITSHMPIKWDGFTYNQTIYRASDFDGLTGTIEAIAYKAHFGTPDFYDVPIKIFMGITNEYSMGSGWIPAGEMELVFDGTIDLLNGIYDLVIPLDKPFEYNGGNITLLFYGDYDLFYFLESGYGLNAYCSEYGPAASRYLYQRILFDPYNPDNNYGTFVRYIPNTMFFFNAEGKGSVSGNVFEADGQTPIKDARVSIQGLTNTVRTNAQGYYQFSFVDKGLQYISVKAIGYEEQTLDITITEGDDTQQDFTLTTKPSITVTGKVVGSNDTSVGLSGATVTLSNYANYSTITNELGEFTLTDVWGNASYDITINALGYQAFTQSIETDNEDQNLGDLMIEEQANPPATVTAVDAGPQAIISWEEPIPPLWIQKDDGINVGMFGSHSESGYAVAHRYTPEDLEALEVADDLYITKIRIHPMSIATYTLKIWAGMSNSELEIYSEEITISQYDTWYEHTLSTPVKINKEENILIGYEVFQSNGVNPVGFDIGPVVEGGDVFWDGLNWTTARAISPSMNYNWNIHAYCSVNPNDKPIELKKVREIVPAMGNKQALIPQDPPIEPSMTGSQFSIILKDADEIITNNQNKSTLGSNPLGYKVWRLLNGQEHDDSQWTLITEEMVSETSCIDTLWGELDNDFYRFAVRSVYTNDVMSVPTFSNVVDKGKYAVVSMQVSADGGSPEGAVVKLKGQWEEYTGTVDSQGWATLDNVYFDDYTLTIEKKYYKTFEQEGIVISDNEQEIGPFEIELDPRVPKSFSALDLITKVNLNWTEPGIAQSQWIYKDDGISTGSIGQNYGGTMTVGQRFAPRELQDYIFEDYYVSRIRFYQYASGIYNIKVWRGPEGTEMEVYSQEVEVLEAEQWVEVFLDEPLIINPNYSHVFGYEITHDMGQYPCGRDKGPVNEGGDMIYYSDGWHSFTELMQGTMDLNWNIHTFLTNDVENGREIPLRRDMDQPIINNTNLATSTLSAPFNLFGQRINANDAPINKTEIDIAYTLWRLVESDYYLPHKWELITDIPITDTEYTDETWESIPNNNYLYALRATYFGSIHSDTVFTKVLYKGQVSSVTLAVDVNDNQTAQGAEITLSADDESYFTTVNEEGSALINSVKKGAYNLTIEKGGYEILTDVITITDDFTSLQYTLQELKTKPAYVIAEKVDNNTAISLSWREPGSYAPEEGWIYWDNDEPFAGLGHSSNEITAAHAYTTQDLEDLRVKELSITKISFYVYHDESGDPTAGVYTLKIWRGDQFELTYSQEVPSIERNKWNEIILDEPFYLSGDETVLVGYTVNITSGHPAGLDTGPAQTGRGDLAYHDGWYTLTGVGYSYNWLIHAYCEKAGSKGEEPILLSGTDIDSTPIKPLANQGKDEYSISARPQQELPKSNHNRIDNNRAPHTGYKVYRLTLGAENQEDDWILLTTNPTAELEWIDNEWETLPENIYRYAVKAVYGSGDSEAEFSNTVDYGTGFGSPEGKATVRLFPNPNNGQFYIDLPNDALVKVLNLTGYAIYHGQHLAGMNLINIPNMAKGIYMITISYKDEQQTFKMIVQ